jgi:hypothetical protein
LSISIIFAHGATSQQFGYGTWKRNTGIRLALVGEAIHSWFERFQTGLLALTVSSRDVEQPWRRIKSALVLGILASHTPPQVCLRFEQLSVPSFKEEKPFGVSTLLFSELSSKRA